MATVENGRSRLSKALPAPPPQEYHFPTKKLTSLPPWPPKEPTPPPPTNPVKLTPLPALPPWPPKETTPPRSLAMNLLPSLPPKEAGAPRSPAPTSPLPPTPSQSSGLPTMSIPRRPVAPVKQVVTPAQPSPTGSVSSLLSAYSRSSGESLVRLSDGSQSSKASEPTLSPRQDGVVEGKKGMLPPLSAGTFFNEDETQSVQMRLRKDQSQREELPPPPPKDEKRPGTPNRAHGEPTSANMGAENLASPNSTSPQIWRRRSVKTERNLEVSNLKLLTSHGSTAASQSANQPTNSPFTLTAPSSSLSQPRSATGLPGNNIKPVPSPAQETEADNMGQHASKLKHKLQARRDGEPAKLTSHSESALPKPQNRLPTPDYEREDVHTPIMDTVVSPISPASSPEPARDEHGTMMPRKNVDGHGVHNARSLPNLKDSETPITSSEAPPTVARDFAVGPRAPPEMAAAATRVQVPGQQTKFPPRTSSHPQGLGAAAKAIEKEPSALAAPSITVETQPLPQEQTSDGTIYQELREEDLPEPDKRASYFPTMFDELAPPGTIFKALPLKEGMFTCYQGHRDIKRSPNKNYPLTCQVCQKSDTEDRFKCNWCYVRMCTQCLQFFTDNGRDLRKLVEHIENASTSSRPTSAAGLDTVPE